MATPQNRAYERLAKLAKSRRAELGLALNDDNAKAAGTSKGTWRRVEKGQPIRPTNYRKIDGLLRWAVGSCLAVLDGRDPVLADELEDPAAAGVRKSPLPRESTVEKVRDTIRLALIATAKGTSAEEIREMSERAVRDLLDEGLI
jgi:hypothetical protein